ncbi:MAG: hypothetical protein K2M95_06100, partial [Clostridiales bacterium]|nr:hypothetical protein [Clostridiales bacterium]
MGILGVDFAANASSKAIKEDISLSAAITAVSLSGGSNVSADGRIATFNYNGTYTKNIVDTKCTTGNNVGMDGSVQSVKLAPGVYLLEAWGAQGGTGDGGVAGGKGGYVKGYYKITGNSFVTIYVAVGGKGSDIYRNAVVAANANERGAAKGGGWNGGGGVLSTGAGTGGGATHFALSNHGQLKDYKTYSSAWTKTTEKFEPTTVTADYSGDVLMVAGGGGGATWASYTFPAGCTCAGGGLTGADGMYQPVVSGSWGGGNVCHGLGGTQTAGGGHKCATTTSHGMTTTSSWKAHPSNGYFGQGGVGVGDN